MTKTANKNCTKTGEAMPQARQSDGGTSSLNSVTAIRGVPVNGGSKSLNVKCLNAGNGQVQAPPPIPMKVSKVQFGINGPKTKACPATAKLMAWFFTDKPGKVRFRILRSTGGVSSQITVEAKKTASGKFIAAFSRKVEITTPVDAKFRIKVQGSAAESNWVPLKSDCKYPVLNKLKLKASS